MAHGFTSTLKNLPSQWISRSCLGLQNGVPLSRQWFSVLKLSSWLPPPSQNVTACHSSTRCGIREKIERSVSASTEDALQQLEWWFEKIHIHVRGALRFLRRGTWQYKTTKVKVQENFPHAGSCRYEICHSYIQSITAKRHKDGQRYAGKITKEYRASKVL